MVESNRIFIDEDKYPVITLDKSLFPFIKDLKFGDKGELDISGDIISERIEDGGKVIKTIKISKANITTRNNARIYA